MVSNKLVFTALLAVAAFGQQMDYSTQIKNKPILSDNGASTFAIACARGSSGVTVSITTAWLNVPTQVCASNLAFNGGSIQLAVGATLTVTGNVLCPIYAQCFDTTTNAGAQVIFSTPPPEMLSRITSAPGTSHILKGGTGTGSAGTITLGSGSDGRIVITPGAVLSSGFEYVDEVVTTAANTLGGDSFGHRTLFTLNNTTVGYHSAAGLFELLIPSGSSTHSTQWLAAMYPYISHQGSGVQDELVATNGVLTTAGSGNITEGTVFKANMIQLSGTGRCVTCKGFYVPPFTNPAGAAIPTNLYGLHIQDLGVSGVTATNVWAIRTEGDSPIYLSGPTTTGALTTSQAVTFTGNTQSTSTTTGILKVTGGLGVARNLWVGELLNFPATGTTCVTGVQFGTSGECIFRYGAGNIRINASGLYVAADVSPVTTAAYDFGSTSLRWRNGWFGSVTATNFTGAYTSSDGTAGITTVKVAGACTITTKNGIVTGITGC